MSLSRLLQFDDFITTKIIKLIYFVGLGLTGLGMIFGVFGGLAECAAGLRDRSLGESLASLFGSVLWLVGGAMGAVLWRVYCEVLIVIFKINENLQGIRDSGSNTPLGRLVISPAYPRRPGPREALCYRAQERGRGLRPDDRSRK